MTEYVTCQGCNGSGLVADAVACSGDTRADRIHRVPCRPCDGSGRVPQRYPIATERAA